MMTEKEKFLHSGPMIPFCCQAGVSADRESNMASCGWSGAEGHATTRWSRGRGSTSEELPAFPHQIKSSVKTRSSSAFSSALGVCLSLNCFCLTQGEKFHLLLHTIFLNHRIRQPEGHSLASVNLISLLCARTHTLLLVIILKFLFILSKAYIDKTTCWHSLSSRASL